jgi:Tfp pilus assembly protein PilV
MIPTSPRGFTLVETLVAITVLIIAIVGPLYAVHKSVVASYTARDSLIASALAQEGIEYIRQIRDYNYLSSQASWLNGLSNCMTANGCTVEPTTTNAPQTCSASGCSRLYLHTDSLYRQSIAEGPPSRFARKITITQVNANEIIVTAEVTWTTLRVSYTTTVSERLYNWL